MADLEPNNTPTAPSPAAALPEEGSVLANIADSSPMTGAQAEQILAELKTIKQNLLWLLLLGGFFAARSFFFHY